MTMQTPPLTQSYTPVRFTSPSSWPSHCSYGLALAGINLGCRQVSASLSVLVCCRCSQSPSCKAQASLLQPSQQNCSCFQETGTKALQVRAVKESAGAPRPNASSAS
ncbi:hypothetical protein KIL84_021417 [Mauremys mutica]|uniref:Uncharacterized protein n=1 Tax=Mauremys mutica TaxID=74926 RepID=A0A9D4AY96_9SAUR|nr:hypothetical protein KIL84_021417 [Mauremys mutica]